MSDPKILTRPETRAKPVKPPMYKVILLNDDFTPREFVVMVLKSVFRMSEGEAQSVMLTAHQQGACVVAVYTREVADEKSRQANELAFDQGFPLVFTTEKER